MAVARIKTWGAEVLTFADLNGEINNILNNGTSVAFPLTASVTCGGFDMTALDEVGLSDAVASATAVGRLRRNGLNLTWHDSTAAVPVQMLIGGGLFGLSITNNATDANNDIDFAVGAAVDSTEATVIQLTSALTKQLDAAWAVGTNAGGLFTGTKAATTWYHCFAIRRNDTGVVDAGFDTSVTAANIPANYNVFRRLGSIRTDGSSNILAFTQDGDYFRWSATFLDVTATNATTAAVTRTLTVPTGVNVLAFGSVMIGALAGTGVYLISDLSANDEVPSGTVLGTVGAAGGDTTGQGIFQCRTNTSAQVRSRISVTGVGEIQRLTTAGWMDWRGEFR